MLNPHGGPWTLRAVGYLDHYYALKKTGQSSKANDRIQMQEIKRYGYLKSHIGIQSLAIQVFVCRNKMNGFQCTVR